ncbi:hypothetical protein [uncultured Clostridium sp.]|uniref:DUF6414 family protein n=1 Tax=uncultured Clostridium sp. TaxID=59620 RepID=UPI0025E91CBF|nr:hypothetical protein [uncultured Clostridium sp.]
MSNPFDILVYLDENLVKNLASLVLTGYIETITLTQAFDRTLKAGMKEENRIENSNQGSVTRIEREGFKDKNQLDACNSFEHHELDNDIDAIQCVREERKIQTTYTTFVLNGNLVSYLTKNNELKHKDVTDVRSDDIYAGDIIEIEGTLTNSSVMCYIDCLVNLIDIFGTDYLNTLLKEVETKMNFTMFQKMLTHLNSILNCNNTQDLIMNVGNGKAVLTVNKDNFMNSQCNIFDKVNCHCKVIGKVIKTCNDDNDTISLLRKTGQESFYETFFEKSKPLIDCLEANGFFVPECPDLRINECAMQIMPINIYM